LWSRGEARSVYIDASQGALADPAAVDLSDVHHVAHGGRGQGAHHEADGEARIFTAKGIAESECGVVHELKLGPWPDRSIRNLPPLAPAAMPP
jgi:hypothetical protein